jgi:hypothetical protein
MDSQIVRICRGIRSLRSLSKWWWNILQGGQNVWNFAGARLGRHDRCDQFVVAIRLNHDFDMFHMIGKYIGKIPDKFDRHAESCR